MGMQAIITSSSDEKLAQRQGARRHARHQLQDHAGLGQGGGRIHRRPRRRSGGRGRRRRHIRQIVRRHPRRRQDQHDRQSQRAGDRAQSRPDHGQARQHPGHLGRLDADVRGDEPRDRGERHQAGDRQGVRLRRRARRPTSTWRRARISARSSSASGDQPPRRSNSLRTVPTVSAITTIHVITAPSANTLRPTSSPVVGIDRKHRTRAARRRARSMCRSWPARRLHRSPACGWRD